MANAEHLAKLNEGVEAWNHWRKANPYSRANLNGANFDHANLNEANLSGADLCGVSIDGANLRGATLLGADLTEAGLIEANLTEAGLTETILIRADLTRASLTETILVRTNFTAANLTGADLTNAMAGYTIFADTDLSTAKGLETIEHGAPSTIGIDTIYNSKGKIPHIFLRKCGVPDNFIDYMASLVGTGIEFYSLFISYSHKDEEFAKRLHADLQANGVRCWYAPEDMPSGKKLHLEIDEAIRMHDKLLLILSPHSMASEWVMTEISKARKREVRGKRQVLFPIRLCTFDALHDWECFDADTGKDSAKEIREYFIPDFSNWKDHDAYKSAFDKLLKDLRAKSVTTPA